MQCNAMQLQSYDLFQCLSPPQTNNSLLSRLLIRFTRLFMMLAHSFLIDSKNLWKLITFCVFCTSRHRLCESATRKLHFKFLNLEGNECVCLFIITRHPKVSSLFINPKAINFISIQFAPITLFAVDFVLWFDFNWRHSWRPICDCLAIQKRFNIISWKKMHFKCWLRVTISMGVFSVCLKNDYFSISLECCLH